MNRIVSIVIALAAVLGLWAAAQDGQEQAAQAQERAAVRILHLAPDQANVEVRINDEPAFEDVAGGTTSGYVFVPAGEHTITIFAARGAADAAAAGAANEPATTPEGQPADPTDAAAPAGTDPAATDPAATDATAQGATGLEPLVTQTVTLEAGRYYTLIATQSNAQAAGETAGGGTAQTEGQAETGGTLVVRLEPAEATVNVTGPDGFQESFTGPNELTGLTAGDYAVSATLEGYQTQETTVQVADGETTEVDVSLSALEQAEGQPATEGEQAAQTEQPDQAEQAEQEPAQPEGEQAETEQPEGEQPEQAAQAEGEQPADDGVAGGATGTRPMLSVRAIEDSLTLPQAGQALVRVVHAAQDAPALEVVAVREDQAQQQEQAQAEGEQPEGEQPEGEQAEGEQAEAAQQQEQQGVAAPIEGETIAGGLAFGDASDYHTMGSGAFHLQVRTADGMVVLDLPGTNISPGAAYTIYAYGGQGDQGLQVALSVDAGVVMEQR